MLPKILQPVSCEDLTRIGANHDGGYVLSKRIIDNTETILSFGLADEFSFEINFNKLNKNIKIYTFDHTVDILYWVKHFFKWLWCAIRYRKSFSRAFTFLKNELLNLSEKKKSFKEYPVKNLDYPNNTMKSDIPIKFLDN